MKTTLNLFLSLLLMAAASCQEVRTVKVTVTEEDGTPIEGASTTVTYLGYGGGKTTREKGGTNAKGVFKARGTTTGRMGVRIEKGGYYATQSGRLSRKKDHDVTYVLRKRKNPIPLYAKKFRGKIPSIGSICGFDLKAADWVEPHGKGEITDLYFKVEITEAPKGVYGGKLVVSFPKDQEGVATIDIKSGYLPNSTLKMPNKAVKRYYQQKLVRQEIGYENKNKPRDASYFFKTRRQEFNDGEYVFNYSKLNDGINFTMGGGRFIDEPYRSKFPVEYGMVEFTYYFNPTPNDRNLEFNVRGNLFKGLDSTERVNEP